MSSTPRSPTVPAYPRVSKTLRPHQPGTLKLVRIYGNALVCVRYRDNGLGTERCTTVELIVDEGPVQIRWNPRAIVWVRIPGGDSELQARARKLGARWDSKIRGWRMSRRVAQLLNLEHQIFLTARELAIDAHSK